MLPPCSIVRIPYSSLILFSFVGSKEDETEFGNVSFG